jgi:hypothetical protein
LRYFVKGELEEVCLNWSDLFMLPECHISIRQNPGEHEPGVGLCWQVSLQNCLFSFWRDPADCPFFSADIRVTGAGSSIPFLLILNRKGW